MSCVQHVSFIVVDLPMQSTHNRSGCLAPASATSSTPIESLHGANVGQFTHSSDGQSIRPKFAVY